MTQGRDAFGKVAQQLRTDLRDGVLAPGTPLVVLDLAKRLRVSPTPVREALSRLSGQGLVEEHRGRGFIAARRRAVDLIELHRLHDGLIATALEQRSAKAADGGPIGDRKCLLYPAQTGKSAPRPPSAPPLKG
jgi:DNA-binding GntR family transcriptional regulator